MRHFACIPLLVVCSSTIASAQDVYLTWKQDPATGRWYGLTPAWTWTDARDRSGAFGAHLAAIGDAAEDAWIRDAVSVLPTTSYWIGLNDLATEGLFTWSNGEPLGYTNWAAGAPDYPQRGTVMLDESVAWKWNDTSSTFPARRAIYERASAPTTGWTFPTYHALFGSVLDIGVGDVNGDGLSDVAAPDFDVREVRVFLGRADGRLGAWTTIQLPGTSLATAAEIGRFDADPFPDVAVIAGSNVYVLRGDGTGAFVLGSVIATGVNGWAIVAADVDGNGIDDVVVGGASNGSGRETVYVHRARPDGSFDSAGYTAFPPVTSLAHGDFDGDGDVDLVASGGTSTLTRYVTYRNDGQGVYTLVETSALLNDAGRPAVLDVDRDGKLDLAMPMTSSTRVLHGRGDCTFVESASIVLVGARNGWAEAGDYDGDGHDDLAIVRQSGRFVYVHLARGPDSFAPWSELDLGGWGICVRAVDLGGDGRKELVASDRIGGFVATYSNISLDCDVNGIDDATDIRLDPPLDLDGDQRIDGCTIAGTPLCFGDGTGAACPCAIDGAPGHGCATSSTTGGVLRANGMASVAHDSVVLTGASLPATSTGLFIQGSAPIAGGLGAAFGDGLRCVAQDVRRLGIRPFTAGSARFGHGVPGDPALSAIGLVPPGGGARWYQLWFRDATPYCTPSTFNLTNAVRVDWTP